MQGRCNYPYCNYLNRKRIQLTFKKTSGRKKKNIQKPWKMFYPKQNELIGSQRKLLQPSTLPNFDACDGLATAATVLASWMNERNTMGVSDVELSSTMVMTLKNKLGKEKSCFEIGSCPKHYNSVKKKVNQGRF